MKGINASPKWRRLLIAATLAAVVVLGLVVTLALAQTELPPGLSVAFIQTSGPNTQLTIGDWYTNSGQGNGPHRFALFVPCLIPPTAPLTVDLYDPELWPGTLAIDEIRDAMHNIVTNDPILAPLNADNATFELRAPDNSLVATTTYTPTATTSDQWVPFTTFFRTFPCAAGEAGVVYTLLVSTNANNANDDNSWRFRITHPDNIPGSGDEPYLATFESSFQHAPDPVDPNALTCQDFYFFVPITLPAPLQLNNFDLDVPGFIPNATVNYFLLDGTPIGPGTPSDNGVWNNGGTASARGGDVFANPPRGWWRAQICVAQENQYIFEPERAFLLEPPLLPDPALSQNCRSSGQSQVIRYTIDFGNTSPDGAAFEPNLTFSLPTGTTFESCSGLPCSEGPSGVVTFSLPAVLPAGAATQVTVDVRLDAGAPDPLNSTAQFDYLDVFSNVYPPLQDAFQAQISDCLAAGPPPGGGGEPPPGIPEPATITLFGLGLAGLAGYARARLRRKQET